MAHHMAKNNGSKVLKNMCKEHETKSVRHDWAIDTEYLHVWLWADSVHLTIAMLLSME